MDDIKDWMDSNRLKMNAPITEFIIIIKYSLEASDGRKE